MKAPRIVLPLLIGRSALPIAAIAAIAAIATLTARPAIAAANDDDTDQTEIKIQAPLDSVDCGAMTLSVLGLTVDIHGATIVAGHGHEGDEGDDDDDEDGPGDDDDDDGQGTQSCADLVTGRTVEVTLSSDTSPLAATEVKQRGGDEGDDDEGDDDEGDCEGGRVAVEAPLQAIDPTAMTVQVLGLTIEVSQARCEGDEGDDDDSGDDDDDSGDDDDGPCDLSALMVGQFVDLDLASPTPPLSATRLRVEDAANEVEVEVLGPDGRPVSDLDAQGRPMNDLRVDIVERVPARKATSGSAARRSRSAPKVLRFQRSASGTFTLRGLPAGRARIVVRRTAGAVVSSGRLSVSVVPDQKTHARVRLRRGRSS